MRGARTDGDNQTENPNEFHEPSFGFASKCAARLRGSPSQDRYQDLPSESPGRLPFANAPIRCTTHCSHGIESHTASETRSNRHYLPHKEKYEHGNEHHVDGVNS